MNKIPMQLPYGAVYFRKSNPPEEDWERDYKQAAEDGYNIFRHWFMWGSIEVAPGEYDWKDFDRQMDLAAQYGIKTIIAEITTCVPEWVFTKYPQALCETIDGRKAVSQMGVSSAVGGFYEGVCLDTPVGKDLVQRFLTALANRYKGHPGLLGYDVWNECNYSHQYCFCESTKEAFRKWLKEKYKDLDALRKAWYRYSLSDWEDVQPPAKLELYPECFDWLEFRKQNAYRQMKWKLDLLRDIDPDCLLTAHGTAQSLENMAMGGSDEWMAAKNVDVYGLTFVQSRKGNEPYKQFSAMDLTRSGADGKAFWHAESAAGPLWYQPQVVGRSREDGRITEPEDIRQWNLTSLACGARGILCPRWRPLLDGPLFGAFGGYGMDGLPTDRSRMAGKIARWVNDPQQEELLKAEPVRGELGIIIAPKTQTTTFLLSRFGAEDHYKDAVMGVYQAFFDMGFQPDFVHIDHIDRYEKLYLPLPIQLDEADISRLTQWVQQGGILFSEGCPGYFNDLGKVRLPQAGDILSNLFGVHQNDVEFTPDLLENEILELDGRKMYGGEYLQDYECTGATCLARDDRGRVLLTVHSLGKGRAYLTGTSPAPGYSHHSDFIGQARFFEWATQAMELQAWTKCSNPYLKARIQKNGEDVYLWIINSSHQTQHSWISLSDSMQDRKPEKIYWPGGEIWQSYYGLEVSLQGRDALIVKLEKE